jgi:hypothetical protein
MSSIKYRFALRNDQLVFIGKVNKNDKKGFICPGCKKDFEYCSGEQRTYFRHSNSVDENEKHYETYLHKIAKEIILQNNNFVLPDKTDFVYTDKKVEEPIDSIRPDAEIWNDTEKILIEFVVSHDVSNEKAKTIEELGLRAVKVDLSGFSETTNEEEVKKLVLEKGSHKIFIKFIPKKDVVISDISENSQDCSNTTLNEIEEKQELSENIATSQEIKYDKPISKLFLLIVVLIFAGIFLYIFFPTAFNNLKKEIKNF